MYARTAIQKRRQIRLFVWSSLYYHNDPPGRHCLLFHLHLLDTLLYKPRLEKTCFCHKRTTKTQISLHICSLISTFVIRCLGSKISLVFLCAISKLVSLKLRGPVWALPGRKPLRQVFSWRGSYGKTIWTTTWPKSTKWRCPANTLISLDIHPVWSESSLWAQWVAKDPRFLYADSEDWADPCPSWSESSLGAHSFCWVCQVAAHIAEF